MKTFIAGLINAAFFVAGDICYSLFGFQSKSPTIFFGTAITILLFFALIKLDALLNNTSTLKKTASRQKNYTNWLLSAFLGAILACSSNGSTLLRWIFGA